MGEKIAAAPALAPATSVQPCVRPHPLPLLDVVNQKYDMDGVVAKMSEKGGLRHLASSGVPAPPAADGCDADDEGSESESAAHGDDVVIEDEDRSRAYRNKLVGRGVAALSRRCGFSRLRVG